MIYLTAPSHISQRGSRCMTLTNAGLLSLKSQDGFGSLLYYATFCGFYDLAEHLIMKHPEQVNSCGGHNLSSLHAALYKRHFHVTNLLFTHGAVVDVQGTDKNTPLHLVSEDGDVDIMWWLLDHGANINVQAVFLWMPLYLAGFLMHLEAVHVTLGLGVRLDVRFLRVASVQGLLLLPLVTQVCGKRVFGMTKGIDGVW